LERIRVSDEIKLDFTGLTFPLEIKCIKHFLKKHAHMSLNVFEFHEDKMEIIGPLFQYYTGIYPSSASASSSIRCLQGF